jgi:hypothetical protein
MTEGHVKKQEKKKVEVMHLPQRERRKRWRQRSEMEKETVKETKKGK